MFWPIRNKSTCGRLHRWNEVHLCFVIRRPNLSKLPMRCHLATVTLLIPFQLMFGKVTCRLSTANRAHRISILDNLPLSLRLLWNVNVHFRIHNSPPLVSILRKTNSFQIPTTYFFKIHTPTLATHLQMDFLCPLFPSGFQIVCNCQPLHPSTHVILISKFILSSWQNPVNSTHNISTFSIHNLLQPPVSYWSNYLYSTVWSGPYGAVKKKECEELSILRCYAVLLGQ